MFRVKHTYTDTAPSRRVRTYPPLYGRLERARQLQNLRQRRYRARKKCSLSALQQKAEQLADDNARLELRVRHALQLSVPL